MKANKWSCLGVAFAIAMLGSLPVWAHAGEGLRLVGTADGAEFSDIVVEEHELRVRAPDGSTQPIPRGTRWRLDGDLRSNHASVCFAPRYLIMSLNQVPVHEKRQTRKFAVVWVAPQWPWPDSRDGGILVFVWLHDGRPTEIRPVPAMGEKIDLRHDLAMAAFELDPETERGTPVVMMFVNQQAVTAGRVFASREDNAALATMHLGTSAEVERALSGSSGKLATSFRRSRTLLHLAAEAGRVEALSCLEHDEDGAEVERRDGGENSALELAAGNARLEMAQALVAMRATKSKTIAAALDRAMAQEHVAVAHALLPEKARRLLNEVFDLAVRQGDATLALSLLHRGDERMVRGLAPATIAAGLISGNPALTQLLATNGARVRLASNGRPLLHYASMSQSAESVRMWLEAGAAVDATDSNRTTPLMVAAGSGDRAVVDVLLAFGADVGLRDRWGQSAVDYARASEAGEVVAVLQEQGAPPFAGQARNAREAERRSETLKLWSNAAGSVYGEREVTVAPEVRYAAPALAPVTRQGTYANVRSDIVVDSRSGQMTTVHTPLNSAVLVEESYAWAVASVVVEPDGSVGRVGIVSASSPEFADNAKAAVERYTFLPGESGGRPVRTRVTLVVNPKI